MEQFTSAERWKRLYMGEQLDRVPVMTYVDSVAARFCNISTHDYYYHPQIAYECQTWFLDMLESDDGKSFNIPCGYAADFIGGIIEIPNRPLYSVPKVIARAIKSPEDVERLQMPRSLDVTFNAKRILDFDRLKYANGESISIFGGSPMAIAENLVGIETLYRWMIREPTLVHRLMRFGTDYIYLIAETYKKEFQQSEISAGISLPLESHTNISPRLFEQFSLPYLIEIMEVFKTMDITINSIHLCGRHERNLECIKRSLPFHGRTMLTIGKEMSLTNLAKVMGPNFIIGGNLSNDVLMMGSPSEVYKEAVDIIEEMKYTPGGFVLTPECTVSCLVSPANLYAMIKAVRDVGRYDN